MEKGVLKNLADFTGKDLRCILFNEIADLNPCNFIKQSLQQRCFLMKFAKFLRTLILRNICERLFLLHFLRWLIMEVDQKGLCKSSHQKCSMKKGVLRNF